MTRNSRLNDTPRRMQTSLSSSAATLGLRRERFVQEYLADPNRNATAAYRRAGYSATGGAARAAAARLLKHPDVRKAIAASREVDAAQYQVQRQRVIEELAKIAFFNPSRLFRPDGTMKQLTELSEAEAAAMAYFQVEEVRCGPDARDDHGEAADQPILSRRTYKVRMASKLAALDAIVKVMGYAKDRGDTFTANPV